LSSFSKTQNAPIAKSQVGPTIAHHPELYPYCLDVSLRQTAEQIALQKETEKHQRGGMASAPDEIQFLCLLARLIGAKKILEVGVFLGSTSLALAQATDADTKIVGLDVSEEFCQTAKQYWKKAGVAEKIDLRIAPAAETMRKMLENGEEGTYDLIFIDADKENYGTYYELALKLSRKGRLICIDNVFWGGRILKQDVQDADTVAIRTLNAKLKEDKRVDISMLPLADGLTVLRKL